MSEKLKSMDELIAAIMVRSPQSDNTSKNKKQLGLLIDKLGLNLANEIYNRIVEEK
ncbi:MAG TPA: hypothetical protein VLB46_11855 [Pyrinomonadaceae bacterium]|nr:hypothetical protein [Pyrinomonadaceae bacterium]